ncbi:MAG: hypothetical protein ACRDNF_24200 [Streptosporangiaceae bacterium]
MPRLERLVSTFVLGYGISEAGGRFAVSGVNLRSLRAQVQEADLTAHRALLPWRQGQVLDTRNVAVSNTVHASRVGWPGMWSRPRPR